MNAINIAGKFAWHALGMSGGQMPGVGFPVFTYHL